MRILLDTHALLWWLAGDTSLTLTARSAIAEATNEIFVSVASAWEVSTKHRIGKLQGAGPLVVDFTRVIASQGFVALPISIDHAQHAGSLRSEHRDPFDRMLAAQAMVEKMAWLSNETAFDALPVLRVW